MANETKTTFEGADRPIGTDWDERALVTGGSSPTLAASTTADDVVDTEVIPLVEETARIEKREVRGGAVRVRTVVDAVEDFARAELQGENVEVTRVPVDREIDRAPEIRTEGDVTIIPVVEEVLVVETRLVLKEEVHLRRHRTTETVEVPVTLRKQRAVVERVTPEGDTRAEEME